MQTADRLKFQPTSLKRKGPQYHIIDYDQLWFSYDDQLLFKLTPKLMKRTCSDFFAPIY